MSPARFDAIVQRVSEFARQRPRAYRRRLIGLACLGYGYVLAVLLGIVACGVLVPLLFRRPVNGLTIQLELLLIGFVVVIVRAMWVAVQPAEGLELTRDRVPALFDAVERVRTRMAVPPLSRLLLTNELNASVQQVPRFGVFGHRNILLLGLPLLQALSPAQFDAVLAHEFGHLSHRHGRIGAWIYRLRAGWSRLMEALESEGSVLRLIFGRFFAWYAPLFSAYSFVLAREQEYEADRSAGEAFGTRPLAEALISLRIAGGFLEREYWPSVLRQVEQCDVPPSAPFSSLPDRMMAGFTAPTARVALEQALAEETTSADTHPCLRERLAALGEDAVAPDAPPETAIILLGEHAGELAHHFDEDWHGEVAPQWQERHALIVRQRERLATLRDTADDARSAEESWELCELTRELDGAEAALPLYRELAARFPEYARGRFVLGMLLLDADDGDGLDHLEAGMRDDPLAMLHGWEMAYDFLRKHDRGEEAEALYARALAAEETLEIANRERGRIDRRTRYRAHDLPDAVIERLRAALATCTDVACAYLVRKEVTHLPERPLYVIAVLRRTRWYRWESARDNQRLLDELVAVIDALNLPVQCYVVTRHRYLRRIARVAGAPLDTAPAANDAGAERADAHRSALAAPSLPN